MSGYYAGVKPTAIYLALGSNLGDRIENLRRGLGALAPDVKVEQISPVYETEPEYVREQPRFLNLVCRAQTTLRPTEILRTAKRIERKLGRQPGVRYGPRSLDIDLLFYGDRKIETPELIVPHPRMAERAFVLVPLADIAPDFVHPTLGVTIAELMKALGDTSKQVWPARITL